MAKRSKTSLPKIIEEIAKEDKPEVIASMISEVRSFQGPLPPPEILQKYDEIEKGLADRIVAMAERQSLHRQKLENKVVDSNIQNERTGMHYAFALTIVFVFLSGTLIYFDKIVAGYLTLGTLIVGHAYNYITQRKKENSESSDNNKVK